MPEADRILPRRERDSQRAFPAALFAGEIEAKLLPSWFYGIEEDQGGAMPLDHHALFRGVDRRDVLEGHDRALDCQWVVRSVPPHEHDAVGAHGRGGHGRLVTQYETPSITDFEPTDVFRDCAGTIVVAVLQAVPRRQPMFLQDKKRSTKS